MSGYTPGPWKLGTIDITPFSTGLSIGIDAESHGELALVVWQMEEDKDDGKRSLQCEANAKLIASAPKLLNTLETIKSRMYEPRALWLAEVEAMIDEAIAEARGES